MNLTHVTEWKLAREEVRKWGKWSVIETSCVHVLCISINFRIRPQRAWICNHRIWILGESMGEKRTRRTKWMTEKLSCEGSSHLKHVCLNGSIYCQKTALIEILQVMSDNGIKFRLAFEEWCFFFGKPCTYLYIPVLYIYIYIHINIYICICVLVFVYICR